jgi:hypothetical protein
VPKNDESLIIPISVDDHHFHTLTLFIDSIVTFVHSSSILEHRNSKMAPQQDENDAAASETSAAPQQQQQQHQQEEDDNEMSLEELLYSTASFHAISKPGMRLKKSELSMVSFPIPHFLPAPFVSGSHHDFDSTRRHLYLHSGNVCSYTRCSH